MLCFFFQAEDGIRDDLVTGVQTCALPISSTFGMKCLVRWSCASARFFPFKRRTTSTAITSSRRSEEHTSELQSPDHLVCRLLLEKKKKHKANTIRMQHSRCTNVAIS